MPIKPEHQKNILKKEKNLEENPPNKLLFFSVQSVVRTQKLKKLGSKTEKRSPEAEKTRTLWQSEQRQQLW